MLTLDHLTVIAPTLAEGVAHVRDCLDLEVPFGQRHGYMGTWNHLLQLGGTVYLEIVALDPDGVHPGRARWFGLDNQKQVRRDWDAGRRLRGWVARADGIDDVLKGREAIFGRKVGLPTDDPVFDFAIPMTALCLGAGRLPRSSTGVASRARWRRSPTWVRVCVASLLNARMPMSLRRC